MISQKYEKSRIEIPYAVEAIDCSPCGKFFACCTYNKVLTFDFKSKSRIAETFGHPYREIKMVKYSWSGKMIATCSRANNNIIIWSATTLKPIGKPLKGHKYEVWCCNFSPDDSCIISGSADKTFRIWGCQSQEEICKIKLGYDVKSILYSPNGKQIMVSGLTKHIGIWESKTRKPLQRLPTSSVLPYAIYSTNGKMIIAGDNHMIIQVWNVLTWKQIRHLLLVDETNITRITLHPDCSQIVFGSQKGYISIWDFWQNNQTPIIIHKQERYVDALAYSKDGLCLPLKCGIFFRRKNYTYAIELWDAAAEKQIGSDLVGHTSYIDSVAFSPDSSLIVSGGSDKTVRLWNVETGKQVCILHTHAGRVRTVQFSKGGKYVLSGSDDGTISIVKM